MSWMFEGHWQMGPSVYCRAAYTDDHDKECAITHLVSVGLSSAKQSIEGVLRDSTPDANIDDDGAVPSIHCESLKETNQVQPEKPRREYPGHYDDQSPIVIARWSKAMPWMDKQ